MEKETAQINFTYINHVFREELGLTWLEYGLADLIYHLSSNNSSDYPGWCYASKDSLSKTIGKSTREIFNMLKTLENKGLIERHPTTKFIRTTAKWYNKIISKNSAKSARPMQKMHTSSAESALEGMQKMHTTYIDNNNINNNIILHSEPTSGSQVNDLISLFKQINPSYEKFYRIPAHRKAIESLLKKYGFGKMSRMLEQLPEIVSRPYAPMITTPCQLESKLGELILFVKKENGKKGGVMYADNL